MAVCGSYDCLSVDSNVPRKFPDLYITFDPLQWYVNHLERILPSFLDVDSR